jgi:hypothetical protein
MPLGFESEASIFIFAFIGPPKHYIGVAIDREENCLYEMWTRMMEGLIT